jgi:hypothetical protein
MRRPTVLVLAGVLLIVTACSSSATGTPSGRSAAGARASAGGGTAVQPAPSRPSQPSTGSTSGRSPGPGNTATVSPGAKTATAPAHFGTLAPGATLPSGGQCAAWVRARPLAENKGANRTANHTTGHHVAASLFSGDVAAPTTIAPRIDGAFTGTTPQILRWAACKWGIDENIVFAQAAIESWWRQDALGDWDSDASACPPGHGLGADGRAGQCPQSYGILQDRWPYMKQGWPGFGRSTAMDADVAYAFWRACYNGDDTWLNTVERGSTYHAGDAWGCVGEWFSGRWHTSDSDGYVTRVQQYESQKIWTTADFQEP